MDPRPNHGSSLGSRLVVHTGIELRFVTHQTYITHGVVIYTYCTVITDVQHLVCPAHQQKGELNEQGKTQGVVTYMLPV